MPLFKFGIESVMPFTIAHAVLAPPLQKLFKNRLPLAGLAIGCMAPDLVRLFTEGDLSHQWSGLIFPDLLVGLGFSFVWYMILRPVLYDVFKINAPINIAGLDAYCGFFLKLCFALVLGSITHLLWDGVSHDDQKNIAFQSFLAQSIEFFHIKTHIAMMVQFLSSILPLPILLYMLWHYYQDYRSCTQERKISVVWMLISSIVACTSGIGWVIWQLIGDHQLLSASLYELLSTIIFAFFRGFLSALVLTFILLRLSMQT